jgi:signal transduction histidine kinase
MDPDTDASTIAANFEPARDVGPPEAHAVLALLRKASQAGEWDLDLDSGTSRRSLRLDQCFGYATAIPGERWGIDEFLRHVHPDDRVRVGAGLRHAVQARYDWSSEFRVVWPDGSVHWLHAAGSIVRNGNGRATRMLGIVLDLTEQRRAESALSETEQLARGQLDALRGALEVLAAESAPELLMEHAMRTITEKWDAHSSSLWLRDETADLIGFELAFEGGALVRKSDPRFTGIDLRLPMEELWPWPHVFKDGRPALVEDIRTLHSFGLRDRLLPLGIITVLLIPMAIAGRLEGAIGLRFTRQRGFSAAELELAQALANQAMLALQLTRVSERGRDAAVIAERMRLARDIHDTLAQGFTGVIVQLEAAEEAIAQELPAAAGMHIDRARALARASLRDMRRSVGAMRDRTLVGSALGEALRKLVATMTDGTPLTTRFAWTGTLRVLPPHWEDNLLHVGRELLTNTLRHAAARHVDAVLAFDDEQVSLVMHDDGCGFDPEQASEGFGLRGIRERVAAIGGTVAVESRAGAGTRVRIVIRTGQEIA